MRSKDTCRQEERTSAARSPTRRCPARRCCRAATVPRDLATRVQHLAEKFCAKKGCTARWRAPTSDDGDAGEVERAAGVSRYGWGERAPPRRDRGGGAARKRPGNFRYALLVGCRDVPSAPPGGAASDVEVIELRFEEAVIAATGRAERRYHPACVGGAQAPKTQAKPSIWSMCVKTR